MRISGIFFFVLACFVPGVVLPSSAVEPSAAVGEDEDLGTARARLRRIERRIRRGELPAITFKTDSVELAEESKAALDEVAELLLAHPKVKLIISGHTDNVGKREYNLALSKRRAESVEAYLVRRGVLGEAVASRGHGPDRPLNDNSTEEKRLENRRVELRLVSRDWESVY